MKVNIIGGGIIGMSTAYHLSLTGAIVTVFEKDKAYHQASFGRSCGGLRTQFFTETNIRMGMFGVDFVENKTDVMFTPNGYLMLFGKDQKDDHDYSILLQHSCGATVKSLRPAQLKEQFPWMNVNDIYRGCITTDGSEGWIDPYSLHSWFKAAAKENGVTFEFSDGTVEHDCDALVIAAGCWSNEVGKHFGIDIPVKGHKHTVYNILTEHAHIPDMPLIADLITGVYIRPEGKGYITGWDGNGEWDSDDLEPNWDKWEDVWMHLYNRGGDVFESVKATSAWAGYYDSSLIDNNAIIDQQGDIYFATGFTGRGLMQAPAVGLTLSQMIMGNALTFDISGYRLNRSPNVEKYVI